MTGREPWLSQVGCRGGFSEVLELDQKGPQHGALRFVACYPISKALVQRKAKQGEEVHIW